MATTKVQSELIADDVALAGNPTTSTQSAGNNTTRIATTAFVTTAVNNLIDSAPGTMDTLNEIAAALGDDPSFTTTVNNAIATKLPLSGGTMTGNIAHAGNFTIDAGGDIILDADGGDIKFQDGTVDIFSLINSSSDIQLKAAVQDKDMIFRGNDGGTIITALTLDMSDAGTAIFNNKLFLGDTASHTDDFLQIETPASGGGHGIQIRRNDSNTDQGIGRILFGNNTDTDLVQIHAKTDGANDNGALIFSTQPDGGSLTERVRITHDGKVGIGTASPNLKLHVEESAADAWIADFKHTHADAYGLRVDLSGTTSSIRYAFATYTGGGTGFFVRNDGTVGIGTNAPSNKLEIKADSGHLRLLGATTDTKGLSLLFDNSNNRSEIRSDQAGVNQLDLNYYALDHRFGRNAGLIYLTVTDTGNVGIGTESPAKPLHISSADNQPLRVESTDAYSGIEIKDNGSSTLPPLISALSDDLLIYTGHGSTRVNVAKFDNDGKTYIKEIAALDASLEIGNGDEKQVFDGSGQTIQFQVADEERMRITSDGFVSVASNSSVPSNMAGLQVESGGLLINGTENTTDFHTVAFHSNFWTYFGTSGATGSKSGSFRITVPNCNNGASNIGYGSFQVEVYLSGYNGAFCHAMLSGYQNSGINIGEAVVIRSGGSHSVTYGSEGAQGFYFDIDIPSYTHPSAFYRITKAGDNSSDHETDMKDLTVAWS